MTTRRTITVATAATALWLAAIVPTWAHPSFRPGSAPAGQTVSAELVIPHSCGAEGVPEDDEGQSPTKLVDVRVPDGVTVTPLEKDGWEFEITDEGFSYTAADPAETTILFPVELTLTGGAGQTLYVEIFQECVDGGSFSWIGTPDREAEYPAAILTVSEGASEPESETDQSEQPSAHESMDMGSEDPTAGPTADLTGSEVAVDDLENAGGNAGTIALVAGAIALAVGAGAFLLRRRMQAGPPA